MKIPLLTKSSWKNLSSKLSNSFDMEFSSSSKLIAFLLLFFCLGINVYVRTFPAFLPAFKDAAVLSAVNVYSEKISKESGGAQDAGSLDVLDAVQMAIERDPEAFDAVVDEEYKKLKDPYQDENGLTYLMEFDPYTWARWTENVVLNGHPGDTIIDGKSYDSQMLAPRGHEVFHYRFLFYFSAALYHATHFFIRTLPLDQFLFFIPVFYAACFLFILFQFMRSWSTDLVAFLAVIFVGLLGACLTRSSAGWYDFDMLNLMWPLIIAGCLLESLKDGRRWRSRVFFAGSAAFFQGIYAMTWSGWPVMLSIVIASVFFMAMAEIFSSGKSQKGIGRIISPHLIVLSVFLPMTFIFAYFFIGERVFSQVGWLLRYLRLGTSVAGGGDIFPNVLYTISELASLSFSGIAKQFYGQWIFLAAVFSIPVVIFKDWKTERRNATILMLCWLFVMTIASFQSTRFTIFLAVPLFFFFSILVGEYAPAFIQNRVSGFKKIGIALVYFVVFGLLAQTVIKSGMARSERLKPVMNDAWHDALVYVDQNTPKDAILNSWWDQGSWFRYYGNRRVIFDGTSHHGQLAYWMARVLLEENEEKAVRILRMLNNSGYNTFYSIQRKIKDPFLCEAILEQLLEATQDESKEILARHGFSEEESQEILDALYGNPVPAYFIVEGSFFPKMSNISFLGNWDFQKLYAFQNQDKPKGDVVAGLQEIYGSSSEEAERIVNSNVTAMQITTKDEAASMRYRFYTGVAKEGREGELIYFDYGLVFNPRTQDALLYSKRDKKYKIPKKMFLFENGELRKIEKENGNDDRVVLLVREGDEYRSLLADEALAESLVVKLLFLKGENLKHFKPFYSDDDNKIYIYEILWGEGA